MKAVDAKENAGKELLDACVEEWAKSRSVLEGITHILHHAKKQNTPDNTLYSLVFAMGITDGQLYGSRGKVE